MTLSRKFGWRVAASGVIAAGAAISAAPAMAGDLSEKRLFPENEILKGSGNRGYIYGQLNKGFLVHDDGDDTEFYPLVDNNNSSTRAGVKYVDEWGTDLTFFANLEGEWKPYSTGNVNQENKNDVDWDAHFLRKLEFSLDADTLGRLWVGQGSSASDGSSEQDLSGTGVIAYSSIADSAGGQLFAFDDGSGLSDISIGSAFSNFDGLGRLMRVRYDTPAFYGVRLSGSIGYNALGGDEDEQWDLAATYSRNEESESFAAAAAIAYSEPNEDTSRINGSASVLHKSSGVSLTFAAGNDDRDGGSDPSYIYGKIGYAPMLTSVGPTAFGLDLYLGDDFVSSGSDSTSVGLSAVQTISYADTAFDIYGLVRNHSFDESGINYQDGLSFLTGARWRF